MAKEIPLSEIRLQGPGVCKCGHKKTDHTKTQTICTATWAGNPPADTSLSRDAIVAMSPDELQQRFGIVYCECMTFVQEGAA